MDSVVIITALVHRISMMFLIALVGVALVKSKKLGEKDGKTLATLVVYSFTPSQVIRAFLVKYTDETRDGLLFAIIVAVCIHILLLIICRLLRIIFPLGRVERASLIYSNAGGLTLVLIPAMLGDEWVVYASAFICIQIIFTWTHQLSLMQDTTDINWKKILLNPSMIAVLTGLILFFFDISLPRILTDAVNSMAAAIPAVGMIIIGMRVAQTDWTTLMRGKRIYLIVFLKMIVFPGIILLFLKFSGIAGFVASGQTILLVSLLAVISPSANTVAQLAQLFDQDPNYASAINVLTTITCIFTMPLMVWLYLL